ncbi:MAG: GNAT family N-acetyltransferase [Kiritimatiellae bacterium]|nr:GNAT family N-acetyltransferase [Kiritimatiellia bacterium]
MSSLDRDAWLSDVLAKDVYRLSVDDDLMAEARRGHGAAYGLFDELRSRDVLIYTKIPAIDTAACVFLEERGFRLVDTNVVLDKPMAFPRKPARRSEVRPAAPEDREAVVELARRSFACSRFHLDGLIAPEVANTIKAQWAGNFFAGKRGDRMVVASAAGRVAGFLLLLCRDARDCVIDLVAVDAAQRRKGIASDMLAYAEATDPSCSRMVVGTQVANVPSLRLYEKAGFRVCGSHYVFHFHGPQDSGS